jgi:hypothetical protein
MTLTKIGTQNVGSSCERTLPCFNLIHSVTDFHSILSYDEVRMVTMVHMNVSLMEYMCTEYDNLTSLVDVSDTRIRKDLRERNSNKVETMSK